MTNREAIEILGELKKCYLGEIVNAIDIAIKAVKAQEPRAIELDEFENVLGRDVPLYFEQRDGISGWDIFSGLEKGTMDIIASAQWAEDQTWQREFYGKEWRCWTSRPTKEQMEAEEWE